MYTFTLVDTILHDSQHISHNFTSLHTFTIYYCKDNDTLLTNNCEKLCMIASITRMRSKQIN